MLPISRVQDCSGIEKMYNFCIHLHISCQGSCSLQVMAGPRCMFMDLPSGKDLTSWSYRKDCLPEMCLACPFGGGSVALPCC